MESGKQAGAGVVILGAGLSGLGCARLLPGARMFEARAHVGGHAWSHHGGGHFFDEGAHICHSRDQDYLDLVFRAAGDVHHVRSSRVVNWRQGQWITYPVQNNLAELEPAERIAALAGFVKAQIERAGADPANYREWCLNQYGEFLTENFYAHYTAKYWRTSMEALSTDWLSGRLLPAQVDRVVAGAIARQPEEQAVFAAFHYPEQGGYFEFFRGLYGAVDLALNARAVVIDPRRRIVGFADGREASYQDLASSLPLPVLVEIIKDAPGSVREAAALLRHTRLLCVNLAIARPKLSDLHWFYIYDREIEASRVSIVSNLGTEPAAAHSTAVQAEIFRRDDESMDPGELVDNTVTHLARILGFAPDEITSVTPVQVPYAYVISDHHRARAVQHIHEWLRQHRIHSMGLFGKWRFIWSDAAWRDGEATARAILASRQ